MHPFRRRVGAGAAAAALALTLSPLATSPAGAASPESTAFVDRTLFALGADDGSVDAAALAERLDDGASRRTIVADIIATDAYQDETVRDLFLQILGRQADPGGLDFWSDRLDVQPEYSVRASLLASTEFLNANGGTKQGFVDGVFGVYLGRDADPGAVEFWSGQTGDTASSRAIVALRIMRSVEARNRETRDLYNQILVRSADTGGRDFHAERLLTRGIEGVTVDLAGSAEAFSEAQLRDQVLLLLPGNTVQRADAETLALAGEPVTFPTTGATANLGITADTQLVAIDVRPHTQVLYGLGSDGQLYSLNPTNGTASKIGAPIAAAAGDIVGFDFNPTVDRLRLVTAAGENLRINPDTGGVAFVDGDLAYAGGDANAGTAPALIAAAYTNSARGALGAALPSSTALYAVDAETDALVLQNPPNDGVLNTVGRLGVDIAAEEAGMDISPDTQRAWLFANVDGEVVSHRVELATGRAFAQGRSDLTVLGAAIAPAAPASSGQGWILASEGGAHSVTAVSLTAPGAPLATLTITGVNAGTTLVGLDVRSATGMPYVLGSDGQLYVLGAPKAATPTEVPAEKVASPIAAAASGAAGFDFNPAVDRLRIVSGTTNLRVNPDNAVLAATDGTLAYVAGDPGEGVEPQIVSAAYTNPPRGGVATSTQLFDLDSERDVLALQNPPNDGGLVTIGALGGDIGLDGGFDIQVASGTAFAVQTVGEGSPQLWTVDLGTGAVTLVGDVPAGLVVRGFSTT